MKSELSNLLKSISISEDLQLVSSEENMSQEKINTLSIEESTIVDDISDFIDENQVEDMLDASEIDNKISKLEELRTGYRRKHKELKILSEISYEDLYGKSVEKTLMLVKEYIRGANSLKKELAEKKSLVDLKTEESKSRSELFLEDEVRSTIKSLHSVFTKDVKKLTDDEVVDRRSNLSKQIEKFTNMTKLIHELLESTNPVTETKVDDILSSYHDLRKLKDSYASSVDKEAKSREITKLEILSESKLKISLPKFNGYESRLDIYTFQTEFLKIHQRTTPKRMMADVLKNNLLEGPALSLARSVTDIDEIWERLKRSYGDPKLLLKKKLLHLGQINQIWKLKDSEKIVEALSKMINTMKDLEHLACEHNIQARLYRGDGLDRIYQLLGDNRVTRWLSIICDDTYNDEELWSKLTEFLEKELRVQQQKLLIQGKNDDKRFRSKPEEKGQYSKHNAHLADTAKSDSKCYFCDENENYIATNGPKGSKIVQYFACQIFTEMTPSEKFQLLRKKGYCIQCLFPGAYQDKGKHSDGRCQRDFVCKHQSHDKYPIKKHVLVCHEHRSNAENQQLLQEYKD